MDKIEKALSKLSPKERNWVSVLLGLILQNKLTGIDIKKLKGREDVFRAKKGKIRIIFRVKDKEIYILAIERRTDTTYK
ncbi:MAG: hypothetical protein WC705_00120 [Candidatus Paceibacterota bacterium]|jgi:mRNA-degrading endonuclease RelE of RelBE toxin-antitoxin system